MASVRVGFPSDLGGMLRSEIWNYKTDPPHNGAGLILHSLYNPKGLYILCNTSIQKIIRSAYS